MSFEHTHIRSRSDTVESVLEGSQCTQSYNRPCPPVYRTPMVWVLTHSTEHGDLVIVAVNRIGVDYMSVWKGRKLQVDLVGLVHESGKKV